QGRPPQDAHRQAQQKGVARGVRPNAGRPSMTRPESENRDLFAIADLAREFGISTRAIRFYESKGLLSPERVGATRIFRRRDRARLMLILRGKRLGFSLRDISDYLSLYDPRSQTAQVHLLVEMVDQRVAMLQQQMA